MKKTKIVTYGVSICHIELSAAQDSFFKTGEEEDMHKKKKQILSLMKIDSFDSMASAEKAFVLGYLAAHIEYPTVENGGPPN